MIGFIVGVAVFAVIIGTAGYVGVMLAKWVLK
jgi:hypothetical protein